MDRRMGLLFVGNDWAEDHHDVELQDATGRRLAKARLPEGVVGIARLHAMIGEHLGEADEPAEVVIGIETDRGPWVQALVAAGYQVYAVNPLQVARYRERHGVSGAKSDSGDAHVLSDMVRTDRHQLRPVAGDSPEAEAVKVVARAHKTLVWERTRHLNRLRHALREYFPPPWSRSTTSPVRTRWSCSTPHLTPTRRRRCRSSGLPPRSSGPAAAAWPPRPRPSSLRCAPSTWVCRPP